MWDVEMAEWMNRSSSFERSKIAYQNQNDSVDGNV